MRSTKTNSNLGEVPVEKMEKELHEKKRRKGRKRRNYSRRYET